jgi:hypothetical protein
MIVVGFSYNTRYDPPECFVTVPLKDAITRSLLEIQEIEVPISDAVEITDPEVVRTILLLYGK